MFHGYWSRYQPSANVSPDHPLTKRQATTMAAMAGLGLAASAGMFAIAIGSGGERTPALVADTDTSLGAQISRVSGILGRGDRGAALEGFSALAARYNGGNATSDETAAMKELTLRMVKVSQALPNDLEGNIVLRRELDHLLRGWGYWRCFLVRPADLNEDPEKNPADATKRAFTTGYTLDGKHYDIFLPQLADDEEGFVVIDEKRPQKGK